MSKKRQEKYAGGMIFSFLMRRRVLHAKRAVAKQCGLRSNTRRSPHLHHVGTDFIPFRFFFFRKNRHTCRRSSFFVRLTLWRRTRRPLGAKGSPVLFIMKKENRTQSEQKAARKICRWHVFQLFGAKAGTARKACGRQAVRIAKQYASFSSSPPRRNGLYSVPIFLYLGKIVTHAVVPPFSSDLLCGVGRGALLAQKAVLFYLL